VITSLDHVVVLTSDINAASAAYQTLFARSPAWQYGGDGADRVLFTLDNTTLELVAPNGEGANADRIRAVLAAQGEGLASICFRTSDIAKMHRRLDRLTLKPDPVAEVESRDAISGATLSWKRTRTATEASRGVRLFFLERDKERPLSVRTTTGSITAMDHVVVSTSDPERAAALYGARLGLDMALDRSHPDWGRLMFFRCGDCRGHAPAGQVSRHVAGPAERPVLARLRHRRHPSAARSGRRRRLGSPHRPQAGNAGDDGAQRHMRRTHAAGAAVDGEGMIFPSPLVGEGGAKRRMRGLHLRRQTPHPAPCRFAPAIHLLPQGKKGRAVPPRSQTAPRMLQLA
jgi:catechol 2,3-dioxygenase-like lactoylglutathione lyase family enzyme